MLQVVLKAGHLKRNWGVFAAGGAEVGTPGAGMLNNSWKGEGNGLYLFIARIMNNTLSLQRFLDAQQYDYPRALQEIRNGHKQSHWIWYVFPQLKGLGHSYNSEYYGISGLEEAKEYYEHPVLGSRLVEITEALLVHKDKPVQDILSPIDARKVRSCMTLFWIASANPLFRTVIDVFFEGKMDGKTIGKVEDSTRQNPFSVDHLDYVIVDRGVRGYHCTQDSAGVSDLYNYFGRWFPKPFIAERINYIYHLGRAEKRVVPSYLEDWDFRERVLEELNEIRKKNFESIEKSHTIDVKREVLVDINNLCHFNEPAKLDWIIKYLDPATHPSESIDMMCLNLRETKMQHDLPVNMLYFWWINEGVDYSVCYVSSSENADAKSVFQLDTTGAEHMDLGDRFYYGGLNKSLNLDRIIYYSGLDYIPVFRKEGNSIVCCNPPLIRHHYRLPALYTPGDDCSWNWDSFIFDVYYDLYHVGNRNAKRSLERGGFNLY